jgi:hypothetical protein
MTRAAFLPFVLRRMMMRDILMAKAIPTLMSLMLFAAPIGAAEPASPPPSRITSLIVYGNDPCPGGKDGEIVVCARQPESERYRIPKELRAKRKQNHPAESWTARTRTMDEVSQKALPDSCSAVGSAGQSGCFRKFQQETRDARNAQKAEEAADKP